MNVLKGGLFKIQTELTYSVPLVSGAQNNDLTILHISLCYKLYEYFHILTLRKLALVSRTDITKTPDCALCDITGVHHNHTQRHSPQDLTGLPQTRGVCPLSCPPQTAAHELQQPRCRAALLSNRADVGGGPVAPGLTRRP